MRHLLATLALCATTIGFSQLPNGSVAPDFTITDIEGEEHNLYSYLDSGYAVIIDFSATWCGPCWNYHTSGVFEEIYQAHGPDGANDVRILFIESDDNTTDDDLHGTGTNTWGIGRQVCSTPSRTTEAIFSICTSARITPRFSRCAPTASSNRPARLPLKATSTTSSPVHARQRPCPMT